MPPLQQARRILQPTDLLPRLQSFISRVTRNGRPRQPVRIGVAVSGGSDSMVLVHLLKGLRPGDIPFEIDPVGLIVDHKARNESSHEASSVAEGLKKIGIKTRMTTLQWNAKVAPSELSNFETLARDGRYDALARVMAELSINDLFLGHHLDDQVELLLYRLIRSPGVRMPALQGMSYTTTSQYLEMLCNLYRTGSEPEAIGSEPSHISVENSLPPETDRKTLYSDQFLMPPIIASNHIYQHRPLLDFPKASILETCEAYGIPYVTDKTNFDPSLGPRNAIRHLRAHSKLPRAFHANSILDLREKAFQTVSKVKDDATRWLEKVKTVCLDTRTGTLTVEMPLSYIEIAAQDPDLAACILFKLIHAVSPFSGKNMAKYFAVQLLVKMMGPPITNEANTKGKGAFNAGKVRIERIPSNSNIDKQTITLLLSRQSAHRSEVADLTQCFEPETSESIPSAASVWSRRLYWDNRYWIRIQVGNAEDLRSIKIRLYRQEDAARVRTRLGDASIQLETIPPGSAPRKMQYTIPVLTFDEDIVYFPTLDVRVPSNHTEKLLDCEVYYKAVDELFLP